MKNSVFIFIVSIQSIFSQSVLNGKVISDIETVENVLIVNYTTKTTTTTTNDGSFSIEAKEDDVLIISSPTLEGIDIKLNANSFKTKLLTVFVASKANKLEEIQVRKFTSKSLGIISKNVKDYSPAERKLYTAKGGSKNTYGLNTLISVDGILNAFSGRTAKLEKAVEVERFETNAQKIVTLLTEDFFLTSLKISKENLNGFLVYASENLTLVRLMNDCKIAELKLRLVELAFRFKEMKNE